MKGDEEVPVQVGQTTLIKHLKRIVGQEARPTRRPQERIKYQRLKLRVKDHRNKPGRIQSGVVVVVVATASTTCCLGNVRSKRFTTMRCKGMKADRCRTSP